MTATQHRYIIGALAIDRGHDHLGARLGRRPGAGARGDDRLGADAGGEHPAEPLRSAGRTARAGGHDEPAGGEAVNAAVVGLLVTGSVLCGAGALLLRHGGARGAGAAVEDAMKPSPRGLAFWLLWGAVGVAWELGAVCSGHVELTLSYQVWTAYAAAPPPLEAAVVAAFGAGASVLTLHFFRRRT
ncbi:MAG: hypothetical protein KGK07_15670 [Chloroflexota bacterium]|nr:hypothetical protein [Chloroflexota bacterium]